MGGRIRWALDALKRFRHLGRELNQLHAAQEDAQRRCRAFEAALATAQNERDAVTASLTASLEEARKQQQALRSDLDATRDFLERLRKLELTPEEAPVVKDFLQRLEALDEASQARKRDSAEQLKQLGYRVDGIEEQIKKDRPVFNRLKDSWLHPDYYYKNIVGVFEDRQRLLHKAIGLLDAPSRVLDIGPGNCFAMEGFLANGHKAVGIGLELETYIPKEVRERYNLIEADYNTYEVEEPFDVIWASHVLEHQPNKHDFIQKLHRDLKEGGWLFLLVPPMKAEVVGGHLNLFNNGYLIYSLVVGGFDCSEAMVTKYGYNCVVFVRKKSFEMPKLRYDTGDIETLAPYFPFEVTQNFNGLHLEINWKW